MAILTTESMFTASEMTDAVNKLPTIPMRLAGLFEEKSVRTTTVPLDIKQGTIVLVADSPRGSMPAPLRGQSSSRTVKTFTVPHLAQSDVVRPEDIQDTRAFGTDQPEVAESVVAERMLELKNNLEMTKEFHRLGAVKGVVYDADGTTELHNIFASFGVTKKSLTITFPTTESQSNPIMSKLLEAKRHISQKIGGTPVSRIEAVIGADAYDKLTGHKLVRQYFEDWLSRKQDFGDNDYRSRGFTYGGITFYEASEVVGGQTLVENNKGHVYPVGQGIFKTWFAPADWMETVNTYGLPFYARMDALEKGRGFDIEVQANPLCLCTYPEALVELSFA